MEDPESENSLFSEPIKMCTPSAFSREFQKPDQIVLALDVVEQCAHALQIALRFNAFEQIGGAAHDQDLVAGGIDPVLRRAESVASPSATICAVSVSSFRALVFDFLRISERAFRASVPEV
jgi:hypothetical protein